MQPENAITCPTCDETLVGAHDEQCGEEGHPVAELVEAASLAAAGISVLAQAREHSGDAENAARVLIQRWYPRLRRALAHLGEEV